MEPDQVDDAFCRERSSAAAGLSPIFGGWQKDFKFAPVPYAASRERRSKFQSAIQAELNQHWLYSGSIQVEIVLYVDVQTTLETNDAADLDNYAKVLLDALKGCRGIFIDDSQVQALTISWLDGYEQPSFQVPIRGAPGDFVLKPAEFYEMPDGLWYPLDRRGGADANETRPERLDLYTGLSLIELMSSVKKTARGELRKAGADRLRAYQRSKYVVADIGGFHRSRIEGAGFILHSRKTWHALRQKWRQDNPGRLDEIEAILKRAKANYGRMIECLAGRPE